MANARKLTARQVARFQAIRASQKARAAASNDNAPQAAPQSAYVDTKMTPAMLEACVAAAGYPA